ncbi:hypothetical protein ACLQ3C_01430 [Gordonia sp. DT30]|uniref:hypothetical protein n=1 Tax=unclassified Gordonia (in: high G+C Gram-positive bacteria) TaxID=2657482 RepID=UPI003CF66A00
MYRKLVALGISTDRIFTIDTTTGQADQVYADTGASPDGLQIAGGVAYWTTMGTPIQHPDKGDGESALDYSTPNGGVHAINVDGTGRRDLTAPGDITTGKQLVCHGDRLYWGDREGHRVSRIRIDGSDRQDLVVNEPGIENQCVGVAVDAAGEQLYWTQKGPAKGGVGKILRAPVQIAAGETPQTRTDIEVLWAHLPEPIDLEIADGTLYWTDRGAPPNGNTLNRAPIPAPGEPGATPEILADGFEEAIGLVVDTEADTVYVSDLGGSVYAVPLTGSADHGKRLVANLATHLSGIAGMV